jgi:hypothetical protein
MTNVEGLPIQDPLAVSVDTFARHITRTTINVSQARTYLHGINSVCS